MLVLPIEYGSLDYQASLRLREEFLRAPLGLALTEADTTGEDSQLHFGLFEESVGRLVGSAVGMPLVDKGPSVVRLRQVVVHADLRGQGHGQTLLIGVERLLREEGFDRFVLYARPESAPFYERCGYATTGKSELLLGIEHSQLEKK